MNFCEFSQEVRTNKSIEINQMFFSSFLLDAKDEYIKPYLYCFYLCETKQDNSLESILIDLNISEDELKEAFLYWEEKGLVKITDLYNFSVKFLPIKANYTKIKLYSKDKYESFNIEAQNLLDRPINPNEYNLYYEIIETKHIEPKALLKIIDYCTKYRDKKINYSYILAVANNWISENVLTSEDVDKKIDNMERYSDNIKTLLLTLGIDRNANLEERDAYLKWTKTYKYDFDTILHIAKSLNQKGGIKKLDNYISKYFSLSLFSLDEIKNYEKNKKYMIEVASNICTKLGQNFESLEPVISSYVIPWLELGFSDQTLYLLASFCFKKNSNTLEALDTIIQKFYKQGIISNVAIQDYINSLLNIENQIKTIFEKVGINRNVTSLDREMYKTWINDWNISDELLNYAVEKSVGKALNLSYLNTILNNYHQNHINTVEEATKMTIYSNKKEPEISTRSYSSENLETLFDNLKDIDL